MSRHAFSLKTLALLIGVCLFLPNAYGKPIFDFKRAWKDAARDASTNTRARQNTYNNSTSTTPRSRSEWLRQEQAMQNIFTEILDQTLRYSYSIKSYDGSLYVIDKQSIQQSESGATVTLRYYQKPSFTYYQDEAIKKGRPIPVFGAADVEIDCDKQDITSSALLLIYSDNSTSNNQHPSFNIASRQVIKTVCQSYLEQLSARREAQEQAQKQAQEQAYQATVPAFRRQLKRGDYVASSSSGKYCSGMVTNVSPPLAVVEWREEQQTYYGYNSYTNTRTEHISNLYPCKRD